MKLTTRGFTLVELMIVIAIIGILAAALFPSMTSYLKRSRDAARMSHFQDISNALGTFFSDRQTYPDHVGGCVNSGATGLNTIYLPKGVPTDPVATARDNGCGSMTNAQYGYGSGTIMDAPGFAITARLENDNGGNTGGSVNTYVGSFTATTPFTTIKSAGSGYVMSY